MKQLIQVLRETNTKQIHGKQIDFGYYQLEDELTEESYHEIISDEQVCLGKCAMGVLACKSGNEKLHLHFGKREVNCNEIMKEYGIENQLIYPFLKDIRFSGGWNFEKSMQLSLIIIKLNDQYELKFEQIAEFLETTFEDDLK